MAKAAKKKKKAKAKKAAKKAVKRTAKKSVKKAASKSASKPAKKASKKAVKKAAPKAPPQPVMVHGVFCHVEIPADDVSDSKNFYGEVFGWTFQEFPMEQGVYTIYQTRQGGIGGGIWTPQPGMPKSVVNYILVDEIDPVLEQIQARGGSVLLPKTQVAGMGWMAHFTDPSGNVVGLWKAAM